MAFDPTQFGATPVQAGVFDPTQFGATPITQTHQASSFAQGTDPRLQGIHQGVTANLPGVFTGAVKNYGQNVGNAVKGAVQNSGQAFNDAAQGKQSGFSAGFQAVGNAAGAALSPITEAIKPVVGGLSDILANSHQFQNIANSPIGDTVSKATGIPGNIYASWAQNHPEASKNLEALGNIAMLGTAIPAGADAATSDLAKAGLNKAETATQSVLDAVKAKGDAMVNGKTDAHTWDVIQPKLSATEQAQAVTEGRIVTKGVLGTVTQVPVGRDLEMIQAAKPYVVGVKNPIEAVSNMQNGIADEATKLSQGLESTGATYTQSQVKGALNKIEPPTMIASDQTLNKAYGLVKDKMVSLVGSGGKLSDLLQARRNFDSFIQKQFPNLYNSDTLTPMRSAIKDIRSALNNVIDSRLPDGKLPDGTSFKESLKKQSLLYDAIDNAAAKVDKVGSNKVSRFVKAHPTAVKVGSALTGGTVLGGAAAKAGLLH